jgi:hypothetical protein
MTDGTADSSRDTLTTAYTNLALSAANQRDADGTRPSHSYADLVDSGASPILTLAGAESAPSAFVMMFFGERAQRLSNYFRSCQIFSGFNLEFRWPFGDSGCAQ